MTPTTLALPGTRPAVSNWSRGRSSRAPSARAGAGRRAGAGLRTGAALPADRALLAGPALRAGAALRAAVPFRPVVFAGVIAGQPFRSGTRGTGPPAIWPSSTTGPRA